MTFFKSVNFEDGFIIVIEKENEDFAIRLLEFLSHFLHDLNICGGEPMKKFNDFFLNEDFGRIFQKRIV